MAGNKTVFLLFPKAFQVSNGLKQGFVLTPVCHSFPTKKQRQIPLPGFFRGSSER